MSKSSNKIPAAAKIGRIEARHPRRKTSPIPIHAQLHPNKLNLIILELFKKYDYEPIDLEALIFCTLQRFEVSVHAYESMYKFTRQFIISNFKITQGRHRLLQEVDMRRMVVSCSHTE